MNIPLFGEVTPLRAFFLFLFFCSNDSNNYSTWSTFGAGMLLQNLLDSAKQDKIDYAQLTVSAAVTFAVLGYASIYFEQLRMMTFLALQSLIVPLFKHRACLVVDEPTPGAKVVSYDSKRLLPALIALAVGLYLWDGLSGLTSGALFLIVLPEFFGRLPRLPSFKTLLALILVIIVASPLGLMVGGAVYYQKEVSELPPEYFNTAKTILGARPESVPDYYAIIGVRRGAEPQEIKKVYRELSKKYHPDKIDGHQPELEAKFLQISDAVRKLTGKASDRDAHAKELEKAEMEDMLQRCVYFSALFALWFVMYILSQLAPKPKPPALGPDGNPIAEGEEQPDDVTAPPRKPSKPLTRAQWLYLLLSGPVLFVWFWVESAWAQPAEE